MKLAGRGHEQDEHLTGVPAFPKDEGAQVAGPPGLVVRAQTRLAGPLPYGEPDRIAEIRREPAAFDAEDFVPAAGLVKAERRAVRSLRERVLELVPVMEDRLGRKNLLEGGVRDPGDPHEWVADLVRFRLELRRISEILEPAAAALRVVLARRIDPKRARLEHVDGEGLSVPPL